MVERVITALPVPHATLMPLPSDPGRQGCTRLGDYVLVLCGVNDPRKLSSSACTRRASSIPRASSHVYIDVAVMRREGWGWRGRRWWRRCWRRQWRWRGRKRGWKRWWSGRQRRWWWSNPLANSVYYGSCCSVCAAAWQRAPFAVDLHICAAPVGCEAEVATAVHSGCGQL